MAIDSDSRERTFKPPAAVNGDIRDWNPEDESQWSQAGKKIANRNLWISIPCLLCGFAVWMYWGVITVQMLSLGFPFAKDDLFTLMAIAGLSGATLRIPSTFFYKNCRRTEHNISYYRPLDSSCPGNGNCFAGH